MYKTAISISIFFFFWEIYNILLNFQLKPFYPETPKYFMHVEMPIKLEDS